jgi:uncharacterized protein YjiS (DUF1127 family)
MLVAHLFDAISRYLRFRAELASIDTLDDRTLRDIGLNRSELRAAAWDKVAHLAAH